MLVIGVVLIVLAALMHFLAWGPDLACLIVGATLVVLALLVGDRFTIKR